MDAVALTRATAVAAFACYLTALARFIQNRPSLRWWTMGWVLLLVHVICAFALVHGWSHKAALTATQRQTAELTGFNSGSGLYVNYAVLVVWLIDVMWQWLAPQAHQSCPRWFRLSVHGFLAFIWFNATVVFGQGVTRWFSIPAWALVLVMLVCSLKNQRSNE